MGTAASPCRAWGDGTTSTVLPEESSAPCLLCLWHAHHRRHWAQLPWLHANKQPGCVQCKHGGRQHKHPASTGGFVLEPTGPGAGFSPRSGHRSRHHRSRSHVSAECGWAHTGPWDAGTCLAEHGLGGAPILINPTISKYNQTSPVPIPCPIADSQASFQTHNQLHSSTSSCPMGPASSCPPLVQAGGLKAAACGMVGSKVCQGTSGVKASPGHAVPGSA